MYAQSTGRIGRVVAAHFERDEDLLAGIKVVLKENNLRTGYIPTITGQLAHAALRRFGTAPSASHPTMLVDVAGPLEVTGSGIFGMVEAPELGNEPFTLSHNVHGEPYVHIHITVTSATDTISGHLAAGTRVNSFHPVSHFTVFLVEVVGLELQLRCDQDNGNISLHHLVSLDG